MQGQEELDEFFSVFYFVSCSGEEINYSVFVIPFFLSQGKE